MSKQKKQPLSVAFIGSKGIPAHSGGIERHVQELAHRLARSGVQVVVYARAWYTHGKQSAKKNLTVRHLPSICTKHLDAISHTAISLVDAIMRGADVIHIHGIGPALLTPFARVFSRARIVVTLHCQDYYHQKWGPIARMSLRLGEWCAVRCSHEVIVVSRELQRHIWGTYHRSAAYIPNGATLPVLSHANTSTLKKLRLKTGYILYVGRLIPHKGVHVLIEAYRGLHPKTPLVIVGAGAYTDEYVQSLKQFATAMPTVRFLGERTGATLDALYRGAAVCVQPSQSEGLSLSLLEAMSYAKPVAVSAIPENLEVINEQHVSFHPTNPQALAAVLQWVLRHPAEARRQGQANRVAVRTRYNWDRIAKETNTLYARLTTVRRVPVNGLFPTPVRPS